jgi:hypothetical protein
MFCNGLCQIIPVARDLLLFMGDVLWDYEMERISCTFVYMTYQHPLKTGCEGAIQMLRSTAICNECRLDGCNTTGNS